MSKDTPRLSDYFLSFLTEVQPHVDSPRLLVVAASTYVELMVNALVDHHCKQSKQINENTRDYSWATKLLLLNELKAISDSEYAILTRLRKLRNKAAHEVDFSVADVDLRDLAPGSTKSPEKLTLANALLVLIVTFWADHVDVFGTLLPFKVAEKE